MRLLKALSGWFAQPAPPRPERGPVTHVVIIDGSLSSLYPGQETHPGTLYKLLRAHGTRRDLTLHYQPGIQFLTWRTMRNVIEGRGINRQIQRAYGVLASRYRPGDWIFLFGYSRGAYAVRSLAGVIDRVGLLRHDCATERHVSTAYRHYRQGGNSEAARRFRAEHCHAQVPIEMIGVWDTVKALGSGLPLLWRLSRRKHLFHNHALGQQVRHAYHALALDETRRAFEPVLWEGTAGFPGVVEQCWFPGRHGDVGGQLNGFEAAAPLANLPFVWMLEHAERLGLPLPEGWAERFPRDPNAPSVGGWSGWGPIFLARRTRVVGRDPSETRFLPAHDKVDQDQVETGLTA